MARGPRKPPSSERRSPVRVSPPFPGAAPLEPGTPEQQSQPSEGFAEMTSSAGEGTPPPPADDRYDAPPTPRSWDAREPADRAPPPPPPRRSGGGGLWPGLLGGLVGGLAVAGAGYWYVTTQPFVPPVLTTRLEAVEQSRPRLDAVATEAASLRERSEATATNIGNLQGRVASLEQAGAAAPERIANLEQAARELRERLDGARATTDTVAGDVRGRLDELRARVDRLANEQRQVAEAAASVGGVGERLASIEEAQQERSDAAGQLRGGFDQLRGEVRAAEERLAAAQEGLRQDVAGLRSELQAVAGRQEQLQQLSGAVTALQQAGGAREEQIAQAREQIEAARRELEQQIASLRQQAEERVAALREERDQALEQAQQRIGSRAEAIERAGALSLAAYELRVALEQGGGIGPTVELIAKSAGEDQQLADVVGLLRRSEGQGVPTLPQLRQGLDAIEAAEAASAPAAGGPAGWLGAAGRNLGTLVDVRPADQPGATPAGEATRAAREALAAGNVESAQAAIRPLAEGGNAAARSWVEDVERRQAVAVAADRLASRLQAGFAPQ